MKTPRAPKKLISWDIIQRLQRSRAFHWAVLALLIAIVPGGLFFGAMYYSHNLRKKVKSNEPTN